MPARGLKIKGKIISKIFRIMTKNIVKSVIHLKTRINWIGIMLVSIILNLGSGYNVFGSNNLSIKIIDQAKISVSGVYVIIHNEDGSVKTYEKKLDDSFAVLCGAFYRLFQNSKTRRY